MLRERTEFIIETLPDRHSFEDPSALLCEPLHLFTGIFLPPPHLFLPQSRAEQHRPSPPATASCL